IHHRRIERPRLKDRVPEPDRHALADDGLPPRVRALRIDLRGAALDLLHRDDAEARGVRTHVDGGETRQWSILPCPPAGSRGGGSVDRSNVAVFSPRVKSRLADGAARSLVRHAIEGV